MVEELQVDCVCVCVRECVCVLLKCCQLTSLCESIFTQLIYYFRQQQQQQQQRFFIHKQKSVSRSWPTKADDASSQRCQRPRASCESLKSHSLGTGSNHRATSHINLRWSHKNKNKNSRKNEKQHTHKKVQKQKQKPDQSKAK